MVNVNKTNTPYYIVGTLATLALLASGVFAVAPYAQFLAPIVALNLGVPLIAVCAVFSVIAIAFSAIAISKNKTISEKDVQLADKTKEVEDKNKTILERNTQLAEKARELKDKDVVISCVDKQLAAKDAVISEQEAQLAEKDRKIDAKNKFIINSDVDSQKIHQERRVKKQAEVVEGDDIHLESLFGNASDDGVTQPRNDLHEVLHNGKKLEFSPELSDLLSKERLDRAKQLIRMGTLFSETTPRSVDGIAAESELDAQLAKKTKAAPKQISGGFSTKSVSIAGIGALFLPSLARYFTNSVSNATSLTNNPTGVDYSHDGSVSNGSYVLPASPQVMLQNKVNRTENMLKTSQERAKEDFGIKNTSYPGIIDRFFSLFTSNDPTQGCTVAKGYANQTTPVLTPCSHGRYQAAPLPDLQSVTCVQAEVPVPPKSLFWFI